MPWNSGWSSGKPSRPPPVAGVAYTARRCNSASPIAASQPPAASISGPATSAGRSARAQALGELCDQLWCGLGGAHDRAARLVADGVLVHLDAPIVHRDRQERGAARGQRRHVDRACQRVRDVLGSRWLIAPLHKRLRHAHGVGVGQVGLQGHQRAVLLARGDHQWALVGLRVEDRAHRVADTRRGVEVDERRTPARLRVAVCETHDGGLLQAEHIAKVGGELGEHRKLCGARVAEHRCHRARPQQLECGLSNCRHVRLLK